jgi:Flp pilus assembly protein TadD
MDDARKDAGMDMTPDPRKPEIQADRGTSRARMGGPEDADAAIRRSIESAPRDAGAHLQLANSLESQGRLEEAVEAARRAAELNPKWANPRVRVVRLLQRMGQPAGDRCAAGHRHAAP